MTDRIPGAPGRYRAAVMPGEFDNLQAGDEFIITMVRDDQPVVEGTPYSKAAVLPDDLAAQICPNVEDPTPADALRALHEKIYPVGAVYISVLDTDPAQLFGGTWERLKDRFLLGAGDTYSAGKTGGEASHKLTEAEMPQHSHTVALYEQAQSESGNWAFCGGTYTQVNTNSHTAGTYSTGSGQSHNNMPPYLAVYMWKRIA